MASLAALFLRHGRKRKLSVDDMNRALKWSDVGQVCSYWLISFDLSLLVIGQVLGQGHGEETVSVSSLYHHIPQPSDTDLYIDTDRDVDLVSAR